MDAMIIRRRAAEEFLRRVYPQLQLEVIALYGTTETCKIVVAEFNSLIANISDNTQFRVLHLTPPEYRDYLSDTGSCQVTPDTNKLNATIVFLDVTIFFTMEIIPRNPSNLEISS